MDLQICFETKSGTADTWREEETAEYRLARRKLEAGKDVSPAF
jgi:hypothetical protein